LCFHDNRIISLGKKKRKKPKRVVVSEAVAEPSPCLLDTELDAFGMVPLESEAQVVDSSVAKKGDALDESLFDDGPFGASSSDFASAQTRDPVEDENVLHQSVPNTSEEILPPGAFEAVTMIPIEEKKQDDVVDTSLFDDRPFGEDSSPSDFGEDQPLAMGTVEDISHEPEEPLVLQGGEEGEEDEIGGALSLPSDDTDIEDREEGNEKVIQLGDGDGDGDDVDQEHFHLVEQTSLLSSSSCEGLVENVDSAVMDHSDEIPSEGGFDAQPPSTSSLNADDVDEFGSTPFMHFSETSDCVVQKDPGDENDDILEQSGGAWYDEEGW
jgi:hypothetical protein